MNKTNLIIGKINSGKTRGILFKEAKKSIENQENILFLDNKEEYFKTFKELLDKNGYTTFVFNLKDSMKSNSFNPLMLPYDYYKKGQKDKAISLINELALEMFKEDDNNADPFWTDSAANYFVALTLILFKEGKEEEINIGSIQAMTSLSESKIENTSVIKKYFDKLDVLDSIYIAGSQVVYAPIETKGSIISVMKQKLNNYCIREQLLNNLCGNEIDLINLNNKTAIFIIGTPSLNRLGNVLINQVVNSIEDSKKEVTYFLDNFLDMPVLLSLNNILEQKNKLYVTVRNKEALEEKYDKFIINKFENVQENLKIEDIVEIGTNSNYPISKDNNLSYFNILKFVEESMTK